MNQYHKNLPLIIMLVLGLFAMAPHASAQIEFKVERVENSLTYQVVLRTNTTFEDFDALTSTAQVTLVAPTGTLFIQNLTSVSGIWENNSNVTAPPENPGFDYFMVGLLSLGTDDISYVAGEEVVLFTFENSMPCSAPIELMEADDPFTPPNQQKINAGNEIFVLGAGNGNAWMGNYGQGSALCPVCTKPIEYTIQLLEDSVTYMVSLRSSATYEGILALTNSAQVSIMALTGGFAITNLQSINGLWSNNTNVIAPEENPAFDYFLVGLTNNGTMNIPYTQGEETPLFTFQNGGLCTGPVLLMEEEDPFYPPNSLSINAGNEIVIFGFGNENAWCGNYGDPAECRNVYVRAKAFLQGPFVGAERLMYDSLRTRGFLPLEEPYGELTILDADTFPFVHVRNGGLEKIDPDVLTTSGNNAIVDWIFLELRDANDDTQVISTRSALIQRDGDIVDLDGMSPVGFPNTPVGDYYLAVRHRNHLGIMSATPLPLSSVTTSIDFTDPATPVFGDFPQRTQAERQMMYSGNINADSWLTFTGSNNDLDILFFQILEATDNTDFAVNFILDGYYQGDVDMNGSAIFQGPFNDVGQLFLNVIQHPLNVDRLLNYLVKEQLAR